MKKILLAIVILSFFLVPAYVSEKSISIGFPPGYNESDINIDYVKRGKEKVKLGKNFGAIQDFDKAININPKNASAYLGRGLAKHNLGQPIEAIQDYDKAIVLNPNNALAYWFRGDAKSDLN